MPEKLAISLRAALLFLLICAMGISIRPRRITSEWAQFKMAVEDGLPGKGAVSLQRIQEGEPWREDLHYLTGRLALQGGNWELGIKSLDQVSPEDLTWEDWISIGDAYIELGQNEQAARAWDRSLKIQENMKAFTRLYQLHEQAQDNRLILADLRAMQRFQPGDEELAYQLAVHLAASDPQEAQDFLEGRKFLDEDSQQKLDRLLKRLQTGSKDQTSAGRLVNAGQGLAELDEWALALQAFDQAVKLEPNLAEAWAFKGEARQHMEPVQAQAALDDLLHAIQLNPQSVAVTSMLALYWQRQGEYTRAANLYRSAASLEPKNPAWYAALGGLASAQGDLAAAEGYYRYATELDGHNSLYWRLLAGFYLTNQVHLEDRALPAATQAVRLDEDEPANLDLLAQVHIQMDQLEVAQTLLDQALQKDARYSPAYLHKGMVFLLQGQNELAHYYLDQARQLAQDTATMDQAERLIQYYFP